MNVLIPFISLVLDWLDAVGSALAIVALFHPALRPRADLIPRCPRWVKFLFDRRSEVDRFIEAARASGFGAAPAAAARREVPRLEMARRGPGTR